MQPAPFDSFLSPFDEADDDLGRGRALSLYELNHLVHDTLRRTMQTSYWVAAEISELRVASNGHCYLELVQKDEASGSLVAKARATIWRASYFRIADSFERATGRRLSFGIKVLVHVSVAFHELYGYSLNILDLDPTYTLGDLAQRRRDIIRQLEEDGVMNLNKELPLPSVIRRVAVISSATAAGYGDFCNQLEQSGLDFETRLFAAAMQGDRVEESVIAALDAIAAEMDCWDVVVIIRGGGATTDLGGFDSYLLAANVAQFPLPVLTGIGHERDDTIIDLVAHTRLKTPTAAAAFLIDSRKSQTERLQALTQRLAAALSERLQAEQRRLADCTAALERSATERVRTERTRFDSLAHRFRLASLQYTSRQRTHLLELRAALSVRSRIVLTGRRHRLDAFPERLHTAVHRRLADLRQRHEQIERTLRLTGPERILALGYSITLKNGRPVRRVDDVEEGNVLTTRLAGGTIQSKVTNKRQ